MQLHPSFAQAAITIASAVNEEGAKTSQKAGAGKYDEKNTVSGVLTLDTSGC